MTRGSKPRLGVAVKRRGSLPSVQMGHGRNRSTNGSAIREGGKPVRREALRVRGVKQAHETQGISPMDCLIDGEVLLEHGRGSTRPSAAYSP